MQRNNDHASGVLMDGGEQLHCQRGRLQPGYRVKRWPVRNLARREFQPGSVTGTNTFFWPIEAFASLTRNQKNISLVENASGLE